jgi:hypothetical protein
MVTKALQKLVKTAPEDKQSIAFQDFIYSFFTNKRKYRPPVYADLVGEGNRCISPIQKTKRGKPRKIKSKIGLHQLVVQTVMRLIANTPGNTNRGLLAWHSTGSGKLCTATAVMDAFWDTDRDIIYVSSVEGKNSNPPENFYDCASRFLHRFKSRKFSSNDDAVRLELIGNAFKQRKVKFMTFAQLAHYLMIFNPLKSVKDIELNKGALNNAILIIDEVHNIFKPLPNQRGECDALRQFLLDPLNKYTKDLKLVILTATPGDTTEDIINLLNMVRDQTKPVIKAPNVTDQYSMNDFKQSVRGLVSFFDMSGDKTKFPTVVADNQYILPMSMEQFKSYAAVYNEEIKGRHTNFDNLIKANKQNLYLQKARKYSNMMLNYASPIEIFSSKLSKLLQVLQEYPNDKHYIYSAFYTNHGYGGQGIRAIANVIEKELGYTRLKPSDTVDNLVVGKRYILATTPLLSDNGRHHPGKTLKKLVDQYNHASNTHGEFVNLFLASQAYNEGIDLKGVRHVHIFEPLLTVASEKQTIGRAVRHCSHKDLNPSEGEWTVQIHRYYSDKPMNLDIKDELQLEQEIQLVQNEIENKKKELSLYSGRREVQIRIARDNIRIRLKELVKKASNLRKDLKAIRKQNLKNVEIVNTRVFQEAKGRMEELAIMYKAIYESAVDCMLFQDFHHAAGIDIKCDSLMSSAAKTTIASVSNVR